MEDNPQAFHTCGRKKKQFIHDGTKGPPKKPEVIIFSTVNSVGPVAQAILKMMLIDYQSHSIP
jgi:hypothetical protein